MKINTILLFTLSTSAFWGVAADEGGLRGLSSRALRLFGKKEENPTALIFSMEGSALEDVSVKEAEAFGEALAKVTAMTEDSFSWTITDPVDESGRRLGTTTSSYIYPTCSRKYRWRCKGDNNDRKLEEVGDLLEQAIELMQQFCESDEGQGNTMCNLEFSSVTFET